MKENVIITKASGEKVEFSSKKLENSLCRAGASDDIIKSIVQKVVSQLFTGITTREIYHIAFELLRDKTSPVAAKYKLKHAIMDLGPSGFPFERYFAEILKHHGYTTMVGVIAKGHCVPHEIDVVAEKDNRHYMIECKFHNQAGFLSDVKIPLYIQSRFKDVEHCELRGHSYQFHEGWVVTNTRFTTDALQYGSCIGLHLVGWDYPQQGSLRKLIDDAKLYPVTCLTSITDEEKQALLNAHIVLAKDINSNPAALSKIGFKEQRLQNILRESQAVCNGTSK